MLVFTLLSLGEPLLGRLVANGAMIGFAQKLVRSQQDPFELWLQCPPQTNGRPKILPSFLQRRRSFTDPAVLTAQGTAYWLAGYCAESLAFWTKAHELLPSSKRISFLVGSAYLETGHTQEAIAAFQQADAWKYLFNRAEEARYVQGDLREALDWYWLAAEGHPTRQTIAQAAALAVHFGQVERAIEAWQDLAENSPLTDPDHWWGVGERAFLEQRWDAAVAAFESGLEVAPQCPGFYIRAGKAREAQGRFLAALSFYRNGAKAISDNYCCDLYAAEVAWKLGYQQEAQVYCERINRSRPADTSEFCQDLLSKKNP